MPILKIGCKLTAIEYGTNLAKLCRQKFNKFDAFSVIAGRFEDLELENSAYDSEIKSAIDDFWGQITIYDTIDLQLARKL